MRSADFLDVETLDATFEGIGKDPWGKQRAGFAARTEIDRREWGLKWNQALETGGVLVGHSVKIEVEVQAVRQEAGEQPLAAAEGSENARMIARRCRCDNYQDNPLRNRSHKGKPQRL